MAEDAMSPDSETHYEGVQQLKAHIGEALQLADSLSLPPEVGARIQEVLDLIDECIQLKAT